MRMTFSSMPKINASAIGDLTADERALLARIVGKDGCLRASKPKIDYSIVDSTYTLSNGDTITRKIRRPDDIGGRAAYVWRMVAFSISPNPKHHCMPMTADFDLPADDYSERRAMAKELDGLADRIVNSVSKSEWHGVARWGRAFGVI